MDLNDEIWLTAEGGYKIQYNASIVLKELQTSTDDNLTQRIFAELWENLHHQGDVGVASYLSVPFLVETCINMNSLDWNFMGLCVCIENCRHSENNPLIPEVYRENYISSLDKFENYLLMNFKKITDHTSLIMTLAYFAMMRGFTDLGKALELMDENGLKEFLKQYG